MNIFDVKFEDIKEVYSGRPGCGCGCRGKYYVARKTGIGEGYRTSNPKMVKKVFNMFRRLETENPGFFGVREGNHGLPRHGCNDNYDEVIFYHETDTRYYWMYIPKKGRK